LAWSVIDYWVQQIGWMDFVGRPGLLKTIPNDRRELMKYMMLIYATEAERQRSYAENGPARATKLCHDLSAEGKYLGASPLQPVASATSVRVRDGKRLVTDGPFAETHEQLGGYFLVDAHDLDDAINIAARILGTMQGTVEIRPILELPGLPKPK
jgi:hypothetical protein